MEASQVPTKGFHACMGSLTPRGSPTSHHNKASDVAFDQSESLGTPDKYFSVLNSPPT